MAAQITLGSPMMGKTLKQLNVLQCLWGQRH